MPGLVHVIDDDDGVRGSLGALLEAKGYAVQAHSSCREFLDQLNVENALCVVADLQMPGMGGLDLQKHLLEKSVDLPFIIVTGHGDVPSAVQALKSGAVDFIEKPVDSVMFLAAIGKAAAARLDHQKQADVVFLAWERIASLTPREREVLGELIGGHANKVIAFKLGISARTVENHRARLMAKMKADSLAELVRISLSAGLGETPA